jgi:flagellar assembly protein FliH
MNTRLNMPGVSVLPFPFPRLDEPETEVPTGPTPVKEIDEPQIDAAESEEEQPGAEVTELDSEAMSETAPAELAPAQAEDPQRDLAEGREQGYAVGFAEGRAAGEAQVSEEAQRLAAILGQLAAPIARLDRTVEEAVAALALEVARCVIGDEVKRSREFLVGLVREAIAKVPLEMGAPRVLLNPIDLDLIRSQAPEVEAGGAALIGDDTIEAGGCIVIADGEQDPIRDRRWNVRPEGVSHVDLTLASRWRSVMLTLFDGEGE